MNTASEQELEILRRSPDRIHGTRVLAPVSPSSTLNSHIGRLKLFGLLAVVAIFLAAGTQSVMAASRAYRRPKAPDFSIMANDGQTYTPDYLRGNVVLLMFWATWCPYCRRAMPQMNEFANEYANSSFTLLGICGSKDPNAWHNYIEQHQLRWPQYLDRKLSMARLFQAQDVPNFFLIDKDGYIVAHWVGWDDSMTDQVEKLIDRTLDEPGQ